MKRKKEQQIGTLVNEFLRTQGLESPLNEYRLLMAWGDVMGKVTERNTGRLFIRNETLYAEIKSSALRADLMLRKVETVTKLNNFVGFRVIKDIVLM